MAYDCVIHIPVCGVLLTTELSPLTAMSLGHEICRVDPGISQRPPMTAVKRNGSRTWSAAMLSTFSEMGSRHGSPSHV